MKILQASAGELAVGHSVTVVASEVVLSPAEAADLLTLGGANLKIFDDLASGARDHPHGCAAFAYSHDPHTQCHGRSVAARLAVRPRLVTIVGWSPATGAGRDRLKPSLSRGPPRWPASRTESVDLPRGTLALRLMRVSEPRRVTG